jgi:hypothetical protein
MTNPTYEPISEDPSLPASKSDLQILASELGERFENLPTREDFSQLLSSVDKLAGEVRIYNTERSAETHRIERIEKWIKEAAEVTGVPIEF